MLTDASISPLGRPRVRRLAWLPRVETAWASPGPLRGASMLFASSLSVQMGAALATTLFATVTPAGAAAASFLAAAAMLLAVRRPRVRSWPAERWRDVSLLGVTMAVSAVCFYSALNYLPLGTAVTIEFLGPLALALVAVRRASHLVAAVLALAGVVLVSTATPSGSLPGLALAFGSAICWGSYILAARRAGRWPHTGDSLVAAVCVAAVASSPLWITTAPHLGLGSGLLVLLGVALLGKVLPYRLELEALGQLQPSTAGIIFSVEPAIAALVGAVALGERLAFDQLLGVLAVVAAGFLALRDSTEPPSNP